MPTTDAAKRMRKPPPQPTNHEELVLAVHEIHETLEDHREQVAAIGASHELQSKRMDKLAKEQTGLRKQVAKIASSQRQINESLSNLSNDAEIIKTALGLGNVKKPDPT